MSVFQATRWALGPRRVRSATRSASPCHAGGSEFRPSLRKKVPVSGRIGPRAPPFERCSALAHFANLGPAMAAIYGAHPYILGATFGQPNDSLPLFLFIHPSPSLPFSIFLDPSVQQLATHTCMYNIYSTYTHMGTYINSYTHVCTYLCISLCTCMHVCTYACPDVLTIPHVATYMPMPMYRYIDIVLHHYTAMCEYVCAHNHAYVCMLVCACASASVHVSVIVHTCLLQLHLYMYM